MNAKLSIWSAYYVDLSPEEAVLEFKKHGITCSEISDEHGLMLLQRGDDPVVIGQAFKDFLDREGFEMAQGHLWLSCQICKENTVTDLFRWLDLYDAIGVKNAVLHVDHLFDYPELTEQERYDRNLEKLKVIEAYIKEKGLGLRICLENLILLAKSANGLNYMLDRLDPDCFGICLDTGHLNLTVKDQRQFILSAGKRLTALHIADNEGSYDQHLMPYGKGNVDFAAVVAALREIDYDGYLNYEIPGERGAPMEILGYKLEYIKKCFDYMLCH